MSDLRLLYVTTKTKDDAHKLANALLEQNLIACANLVPQIESIYRWNQEVQTEVECLLILKTHTAKVAQATREIERLHTYETPCVLELKVESGSTGYMAWLLGEVLP